LTKVSIIIPTYNEAENVGDIVHVISKIPFDSEVVIVDDNSPDKTCEVVKALSREFATLKLLSRPQKMGLGSAYRDGLKLCSGNVVVEMDSDLSHDHRDLVKLVKALENADMVIGSRYVEGGKIIGWSRNRRVVSGAANLLVKIVLGLGVKDATSGFRAYRKNVFERIISVSRLNGYAFQVETAHIAKMLGLRIVETPITFAERKRGNSKLGFPEMFSFFKAVVILKFRFKMAK
jgi:dolichol-phosphate mannosyltransferase